MRLERRLAGNESGSKGRSNTRNWALGWTGVGLGLATALVIAVVACDVNFSGSPAGAVMSAGRAIPAPSAMSSTVSQPAVMPTQPSVTTPAPTTDKTASQEMAQERTKKSAAQKDSAAPAPSSLPDGLIQAVSGNGR